MTAQDLRDLIDDHTGAAVNLTAGLTEDGQDELLLEDDQDEDDDEQ